MQILRIPPYPISVSYDVPEASSEYFIVIKNKDLDDQILSESATSTAGSKFVYNLPEYFSKYDESYSLAIYENNDDEFGDLVVEDNLEIKRPYVDPSTLGSTATEIAKYKDHEMLARAIIDSVTGGFYFTTKSIDTVGQGTDYIAIWDRAYKILQAYENNELVYDSSLAVPALGDWDYVLLKDKTGITKNPVGGTESFNRSEQKPLQMPLAESDSISLFDTGDSANYATITPGVVFPTFVDYFFELEVGYKVVPYDIQEATKMLINDIDCGKLEYYKRYITNYSTDQYRIQIDKSAFDGTGNILVDKILAKYVTNVGKPGVL